MIRAIVQADAIDVALEHGRLALAGVGGIATFAGLVRGDDGVELLTLEHYPGVTERALATLANQAARRWQLAAATIVHRVGPMRPGEVIVFAAAAAAHRGAALDACAYLIDRLKTDAPFWKSETRAGGTDWVEPRATDAAAADRWRDGCVSGIG